MKTSATMYVISSILGWVWMLGMPVWIICLILFLTSDLSIWWATTILFISLFAKMVAKEYMKESAVYSKLGD